MYRVAILTILLAASCAASDQDFQMSQKIEIRSDEFESYLSREDETVGDTSYNIVAYNLAFNVACWQGKRTTNVGHATLLSAKYAWYGCWCGPGGSGRTVDRIDNCCKTHDKCYRGLAQKYKGLPRWTLSLAFNNKYKVSCSNRRSTCHGSGFPKAVCECDRNYAYCINKYKSDWKWWNTLLFARRDC